MGIIGFVAKKAAVKIAQDAAILGTAKVVDNLPEVFETEEYIERRSISQHKMYIKGKAVSKRAFFVLDDNKKKKYYIKTGFGTKKRPSIRLYDIDKNEIARVVQKTDFMYHDKTYIVSLKSEEDQGYIYQHNHGLKLGLDVDYNGWTIDGSFALCRYSVLDNKRKTIMTIHDICDDSLNDKHDNMYIIEYDDLGMEMDALLIVMTLELALHADQY